MQGVSAFPDAFNFPGVLASLFLPHVPDEQVVSFPRRSCYLGRTATTPEVCWAAATSYVEASSTTKLDSLQRYANDLGWQETTYAVDLDKIRGIIFFFSGAELFEHSHILVGRSVRHGHMHTILRQPAVDLCLATIYVSISLHDRVLALGV